ncbi:hypothetical protein [Paractinoplanes lichenicola]|uniref:Uncharacterized protein n=1 Tax=Paractinoplanes lichenicola TaxID=2802976 RepID=A0ABS1VXJ4_9ACTN|nr:hypothetical protein [Actinoplanes lichenicola]MBL7259164.1 hypothetical protein [Actinoplanes lichenicola]
MSKNTVKSALTRKRRSRARRRTGRVLVVLLRFVLGRALDGRRYSNATFWKAATRRVGVSPYLVTWRWWAMAAGWQKAGIRLTAVAALVMVLVGVAW